MAKTRNLSKPKLFSPAEMNCLPIKRLICLFGKVEMACSRSAFMVEGQIHISGGVNEPHQSVPINAVMCRDSIYLHEP